MADLPILFSASMVRAILREIDQPGTGKTQTRRLLTSGCDVPPAFVRDGVITAYDENDRPYRWPNAKAVGDRLYVREAWCSDTRNDSTKPSEIATTEPIWFAADAAGINITDWSLKSSKNRPGMFLPRWASRITLIVTDVRVQRLQEITPCDCLEEGILPQKSKAREDFQDLWDGINAAPGFGWDANPWVAAYTFRPILANIDQVRP